MADDMADGLIGGGDSGAGDGADKAKSPEEAMQMALKAGDPAAAIAALKTCGYDLQPSVEETGEPAEEPPMSASDKLKKGKDDFVKKYIGKAG